MAGKRGDPFLGGITCGGYDLDGMKHLQAREPERRQELGDRHGEGQALGNLGRQVAVR